MLDCRFYSRGREGDKNMGGVSNKCSTYTTDLKLEEGDYRIWISQIWVRYNVFHNSARGCNRKCTASRTGIYFAASN